MPIALQVHLLSALHPRAVHRSQRPHELRRLSCTQTGARAKKLMRVAVAAALLVKTAALSMAARGLPLQPSGKVVILGGGLQGCASAYYLKQRGFEDVTIVERTSVAAAASGKGGGFLARGWGLGPDASAAARSRSTSTPTSQRRSTSRPTARSRRSP